MGEFEKGQNEDKFGQTEKGDKSAFQQLGDDKGEGGEQDIGTDSTSTAQAKPDELAGAEGGQDYGKQQGGQDFGKQQGGQSLGQDKQQQQQQQQQGETFGQDKQQRGEDDLGGKFQQGDEDSKR